jgi:ribosome-binding protein aMBF1 (putative translation factor)
MRCEVFEVIKKEQEIFYNNVGRILTSARLRKSISIAELAKLSGEQNKTIRFIEKGNCCSLHHLVWMTKILNIDLAKFIKDSEGKNAKKSYEGESLADII